MAAFQRFLAYLHDSRALIWSGTVAHARLILAFAGVAAPGIVPAAIRFRYRTEEPPQNWLNFFTTD